MTYTFTDSPQIDEEYNPTEEDWAIWWDDDQELEAFSLECAFGPEE
jgi:hypothetical protein